MQFQAILRKIAISPRVSSPKVKLFQVFAIRRQASLGKFALICSPSIAYTCYAGILSHVYMHIGGNFMNLHKPTSDFNDSASPEQVLRFLKTGCKILAAAEASMAQLEVPERDRPASVRSGRSPILAEVQNQRRTLHINEGAGYVAAGLGCICTVLFQSIPELLTPAMALAALGAMALRDTMKDDRNLTVFTHLAEEGGVPALKKELRWTAQTVRNMANDLDGHKAQKLDRQLRAITERYNL